MISVHTIVNVPVSSNCFVLYDKAVGRECIVVDPGSKNNAELFALLEEEELNPQYIILTHEHFDHCWGVNGIVERFGSIIICSEKCAECIRYEKRNCSVFYDYNERFIINSRTISVESLKYRLPFADTEFHFFVSPGHTSGSICIIVEKCLFTGDTLIENVRTVTKLPTGSITRLKESIDVISRLKGQGFIVYPGHGSSFSLDSYDLGKA